MQRIALTTAAVVAALTLAACGAQTSTSDNTTAAPPTPATAAATGEDHNSADVTFAQGMIPHHEQAIEMAKLASTRAQSPDVKALASQIQAAQDPEINQMKEWLASWGEPSTMPSGMNHAGDMSGGMMDASDMTKLEGLTGQSFDREFLTMMTAHHQGAIDMAQTEQANGLHEPAKIMADNIVRTQSDEIMKMAELLKSSQ